MPSEHGTHSPTLRPLINPIVSVTIFCRSEYKQRHTVKFLVGMSLCGTNVYTLRRETAFFLTATSRFGPLPLGTRSDIIPARSFSQGKDKGTVPMTAQGDHNTYETAHLRVHVERAISQIKGGWWILHSPLIRARLRLVSAVAGICARVALYGRTLRGLQLQRELTDLGDAQLTYTWAPAGAIKLPAANEPEFILLFYFILLF